MRLTPQLTVDFGPFLATLAGLTDERLAQLIACLPSRWAQSWGNKVADRLKAVRDHSKELRVELLRSIS